MPQLGFKLDTIELGRFHVAVHGDDLRAITVQRHEEIVLAADGDAAQRAFGRIVVRYHPDIVSAPATGSGHSGSHRLWVLCKRPANSSGRPW